MMMRPDCARRAVEADRLALCPDGRETGHAHPLASQGFRVVLAAKSKPHGRPRLPTDLQRLIAEMAAANRTWGEERIASQLLLKLGIRVSPRTVRRYLPRDAAPWGGARSQRWSTFVRN